MAATGEPVPAPMENWVKPGDGALVAFPPKERWDDWIELDAKAWPRKVPHHYMLVPTICFNCEAACGLLAYVDKETMQIRKFEGNPEHPGSRGRNCAKGPATINQVNDPERILYPLKRAGRRGEGKWERTTWDEVLDTLAGRIRRALQEQRYGEIMYPAAGRIARPPRCTAAQMTTNHGNVARFRELGNSLGRLVPLIPILGTIVPMLGSCTRSAFAVWTIRNLE